MQTVTSNSWHLHKASILAPSMTETLPSEFEVIVVGTGLVESMVAAAAARMGHSILHVDTAKFYGGDWASFTWDGLQEWINDSDEPKSRTEEIGLEEGEEIIYLAKNKSASDLRENWFCESEGNHVKTELKEATQHSESDTSVTFKETEKTWNREMLKSQSRKFNLDLTPRLLFARGPMVELLISSNISRYTEFKSVTRVLTLLDGNLEQVPSSRSDVFNTKHINVVEKRILMKFLTQCLHEDIDAINSSTSFGDYLKSHKLTANLTHFIVNSIAMTPTDAPVRVGLESTQKFLASLGRFGPTPFLWSMYGTGELPQAFCRLCAVFGGIYYLGRTVEGIVIKEEMATAVLIEEKKINCKHLVLPEHKIPNKFSSNTNSTETTSRAVIISKESLLPTEKEQITFISLPSNFGKPVNIIEVGQGTAACPKGLHVLHASVAGDADCEHILRESGIIKDENLVYSLTFTQTGSLRAFKTGVKNLWSACGPISELDFDSAIEQAREIYTGMFPGEEFLPRAPDPEEIILGEENSESKDIESQIETSGETSDRNVECDASHE